MTDTQNSYFKMLDLVAKTMAQFSAVWSGNTIAASLNAELTAAIAGMHQSLSGQMRVVSAEEKTDARKALEDAVFGIVKGLKAYALISAGDELPEEAFLSRTRLEKMAQLALIGVAQRIAGVANAHLAYLAPFGITAPAIAAAEAKAAAFTALLDAPATALNQRKEHTRDFEAWRKSGVATCKKLDLLIPIFEAASPDFVWRYTASRKLQKQGSRKRALTVRVSDAAGEPIAMAMVTIPEQKVRRRSTEKGQVYFQHLKEGQHTLRIVAEGYAMKEVPVFIKANQRTVAEVIVNSEQ